ncbi:S24 family peptidase [Sphingomonas sp. URHD0057]|uniref:S24 family peptidase n=1 Tax=Sphingomonas sp. URHD0057 TaxID=1380389 RepID=UPI00048DDFD3|nr:S24 family peptidase [Sphingomonas sp. URHD0057]
MAEEAQIYRELMRFKPEDLTPNGWAIRAGVSRTVWADMRRHGNPSRRTLEKLLAAAGSSLAEFEALRLEGDRSGGKSAIKGVEDTRASAWSQARLPSLPLVGTDFAGEWPAPGSGIALVEVRPGEIIERLPRPVSMAGDPRAYAITIVAKSMWPRFRPGRRVAVSPRASVAIGDDVLLSLRSGGLAVIGELVERANHSAELRQFNPDRTFSIDGAEIRSIHKIVGDLI